VVILGLSIAIVTNCSLGHGDYATARAEPQIVPVPEYACKSRVPSLIQDNVDVPLTP
jgi:hypothetical protein